MSEAMLHAMRKSYGAFYTPRDTAHYLASWALRSDRDVVLEPSIGDGQFVQAALDVAAARGWSRPSVVGAELNPAAARDVIGRGLVRDREIWEGDFLSAPIRSADAAIGNPPYVRLRALSKEQSCTAQRAAAQDMGETMRTSGSVWMPFVSRSAAHLSPGGRLAFVLPWDFTYVAYARPLWAFLGRTFGSLRVVRVRERVFPDISQDVLLLLADGKGQSTSSVNFETFATVGHLVDDVAETRTVLQLNQIVSGERVFQRALLPKGLAAVLDSLDNITVPARELARFNIGYVSGDKHFFHPPSSAGLPDTSLIPSLTNARRLRGGGLYTSRVSRSAQSTLWLPGPDLSETERRYVDEGRRLGVDQRYKCRVRDPWYRVPGVKVPDLVLSVFSSRPILMVNDGGHVASNSLLCGYLVRGTSDEFAAAWYNSLTLLNAELEVHSLGGGVLVLVPNEANNIRVLRPSITPATVPEGVSVALIRGELDEAYAAGDGPLLQLVGSEGLDLIRAGIETLAAWRMTQSPTGSK